MNYLYVAGIASLFGMEDETLKNYFAVSSYLFPPGWVPCCALGVGKCYEAAATTATARARFFANVFRLTSFFSSE